MIQLDCSANNYYRACKSYWKYHNRRNWKPLWPKSSKKPKRKKITAKSGRKESWWCGSRCSNTGIWKSPPTFNIFHCRVVKGIHSLMRAHQTLDAFQVQRVSSHPLDGDVECNGPLLIDQKFRELCARTFVKIKWICIRLILCCTSFSLLQYLLAFFLLPTFVTNSGIIPFM